MLEILKYIGSGIIIKTLASFDDMVARIPIIAHFSKTKKGRISLAFGNFLAVTVAIALSWGFVEIIENFSNINIISSLLILFLAVIVYFDLFKKKEPSKIRKTKQKVAKKIHRSSFLRLIYIGFFVSLITLLDDFIVLSPLFSTSFLGQISAIVGIYISTLTQLVVMIYFGKKVAKLKYLKEISVVGMIILAIFTYF